MVVWNVLTKAEAGGNDITLEVAVVPATSVWTSALLAVALSGAAGCGAGSQDQSGTRFTSSESGDATLLAAVAEFQRHAEAAVSDCRALPGQEYASSTTTRCGTVVTGRYDDEFELDQDVLEIAALLTQYATETFSFQRSGLVQYRTATRTCQFQLEADRVVGGRWTLRASSATCEGVVWANPEIPTPSQRGGELFRRTAKGVLGCLELTGQLPSATGACGDQSVWEATSSTQFATTITGMAWQSSVPLAAAADAQAFEGYVAGLIRVELSSLEGPVPCEATLIVTTGLDQREVSVSDFVCE